MADRKVILYIASSVDGYIARKNGDVDWLSIVEAENEDYGYKAFYQTIDTVLIGRKTYEQVLTFGDFPYRQKACYVFSSKSQTNTDDVQFVDGDIVSLVNDMKNKAGKDIWLVGGSKLIESFMSYDLIDEYIISVIPMILGEGIPLFENCNPQHLKLVDTISYDSGLVQMHYTTTSNSID